MVIMSSLSRILLVFMMYSLNPMALFSVIFISTQCLMEVTICALEKSLMCAPIVAVFIVFFQIEGSDFSVISIIEVVCCQCWLFRLLHNYASTCFIDDDTNGDDNKPILLGFIIEGFTDVNVCGDSACLLDTPALASLSGLPMHTCWGFLVDFGVPNTSTFL